MIEGIQGRSLLSLTPLVGVRHRRERILSLTHSTVDAICPSPWAKTLRTRLADTNPLGRWLASTPVGYYKFLLVT